MKVDIGKILQSLCERKGVNIIAVECCSDHIHILMELPLYMSVARLVGYSKRKGSLMICNRHVNLKETVTFGADDIM